MSAVPELLAANERYAAGFTKGHLPRPPARRVAILTCMDARLDPAKFLGLQEGEAHIIRNAGGRATEDAIRSLIISSQVGGTREVLVIHNTDCGMLTFTNEQLHDRLQRNVGVDASGIDFLPFSDLEQSVREDVEKIRSSPFLPKDILVSGFVYDVYTGRLHQVMPAGSVAQDAR